MQQPQATQRRDPVVDAASRSIGGSSGRFARVGRLRPMQVAAWLSVGGAIMVALAVFQKGHCVVHGWGSDDQLWRACYSDYPNLWLGGLSQGQQPYGPSGAGLGESFLGGMAMWLVALVSPQDDGFATAGDILFGQQFFFAMWAAITVLLLAGIVAATVATTPRTPWRAAAIALSPTLVTAGLLSPVLLGVLFVSLALMFYRRGRLGLAGVSLGVSLLSSMYPLVLVLATLLLAYRGRRMAEWARLPVGAAVGWFVPIGLFLVLNPDAALGDYRGAWESGPQYGSTWRILEAMGVQLSAPMATWLMLLGWIIAFLVGAWLVLGLRRAPDAVGVSAVMLAVVMLTGKEVTVQSALWFLPFIALAAVPWRDHLIWAGTELFNFVAVWIYAARVHAENRSIDADQYAFVLLVRAVGMVWLVVSILRSSQRDIVAGRHRPGVVHAPGADPLQAPAASPSSGGTARA